MSLIKLNKINIWNMNSFQVKNNFVEESQNSIYLGCQSEKLQDGHRYKGQEEEYEEPIRNLENYRRKKQSLDIKKQILKAGVNSIQN